MLRLGLPPPVYGGAHMGPTSSTGSHDLKGCHVIHIQYMVDMLRSQILRSHSAASFAPRRSMLWEFASLVWAILI